METIAAIATARGTAGIAVIRVSGKNAFEVCGKVFFPKNKNINFLAMQTNHAVFGEIRTGERVIDEGIALKFFAPNSYTGENTVEISCHGSMYIANAVLKSVIDAGARLAGAGEFTRRAYINGKISLTGAEAVGRLIQAVNETGARVALAQSKGGLSRLIESIAEKIKQILSEVYVYIDYPEEDLTEMTPDIMHEKIEKIRSELQTLKNSYSAGKIIADGIKTAIIGKPNTGKSTLLNMLSNRDVAIVHNTAGTTRDIIESRVNIGGYTLNLFDTAGIRETGSEIEQMGIERAYNKIDECDLIIGVFDMSKAFDGGDENIIKIMAEQVQEKQKANGKGKNVVAVLNKCDIAATNENGYNKYTAQTKSLNPVTISAKENKTPCEKLTAYDAIKAQIERLYDLGGYNLDAGEILTEERQYFEICGALDAIDTAVASLKSGQTQDIAGMDLELAVAGLDRCDPKSLSEDIVDRIFRNFCVGK